MRLWLAVAALASSVVGVVGCQSSTFACQSDGACPQGRCESQGWCSFPDASCPSGFRFADHAAEGLAGTCVDVAAGETETGTTGVTTTTVTPATATTGTTSTTSSGTTEPVLPETSGSTTTTADATQGETSDASSTGSTGPAAVVVTVPIAADADDGAIYATPEGGTVWALSGEDGVGNGFFGEYPDGEYYVAYFRFVLPPETDTSTLTAAHLRLEATSQVTYFWSDNHAVGIWLESDADAPAVPGVESFPTQLGGSPTEGVTLLESAVRWPEIGALTWLAGTNVSPDVTSLLEALADEPGSLSAGDHIQFWLAVATPTGTGGEVTYVDYASPRPTPPELELTFERR